MLSPVHMLNDRLTNQLTAKVELLRDFSPAVSSQSHHNSSGSRKYQHLTFQTTNQTKLYQRNLVGSLMKKCLLHDPRATNRNTFVVTLNETPLALFSLLNVSLLLLLW